MVAGSVISSASAAARSGSGDLGEVAPARAALEREVLLLEEVDAGVDLVVAPDGAVILLEQDTGEFAPQGFGEKGGGFFSGHGLENGVSHHSGLFAIQGCEETSRTAHRLGQKRGPKRNTKKIAGAIFLDDVG